MSRGVLYVYWGDAHGKLQERSVESLKRHHPELPVHVERLPDDATLLDKARMFNMSPFEETLFLDTDTVVVGRLDFAFDKAAPLFDAWEGCARRVDSSSYHLVDGEVGMMPVNDQAAFAVAVEETGYTPFVLPLNWNFRPQWHLSHFGPIRIWHGAGPCRPSLGTSVPSRTPPRPLSDTCR